VADIPSISGCYALMSTREEALAELKLVFDMVAESQSRRGPSVP
jgi:predicted RNase H-like HicB family nuclease